MKNKALIGTLAVLALLVVGVLFVSQNRIHLHQKTRW